MLKAMRTLLLLAVLAAPLAAQDAQPPTVTLKDKAQIDGPVVRLCDVADVAGKAPDGLKDLVLGNAPWPGNAREISRMLLKARMLNGGYDPGSVQFAGADVCVARAAFLRVDPQRIEAAAIAYAKSLFPARGPDVTVALERPVEPVIVAAGDQPELHGSYSGRGAPAGSVRVNVEISRGGVLLKRVPVSLSVRVTRTVAVARQLIAPGQALTARNVAFTRRDVTDVAGAYVASPQELAGRVADRLIAPGEVVTSRLAAPPQPPVVIKPNQRVFLVVRTATLRVVTIGTAVGSARLGEAARARNLSTGREVVGTAAAGGVIEVSIGGPSNAN